MSGRGGAKSRRAAPEPARAPDAVRPPVAGPRGEARFGTAAGAALSGCVVAVARHADHAAFAALFAHFAPRLKTYFLRSGMPDAAAEELAQETMAVVWRKADSFDPAKAAASTWVFTIGRNLRTDALRRGGHAAAPAPPGVADGDGTPEAGEAAPTAEALVASAQHEQRLRHALRALPREQAEVLRLSYFGDRSHAEIARGLGVPLGTVKGRIRQALARLRAALGGDRP